MKRVTIPTMTKFVDPGRPYSIVPLAIQGDVMLNTRPRMTPDSGRGYYRLTHIPTGRVLASYWDREHTDQALAIAARHVPDNMAELVDSFGASHLDTQRYYLAMQPLARALLDTRPVERQKFFDFIGATR